MSSEQPIRVRVGSAGDSGAGKTRWLFGLLRALACDKRARLGAAARKYLQFLSRQDRDGGLRPTDGVFPRLEVSFPNGLIPGRLMPQLAADRMIRLEFVDIGGGELAAETTFTQLIDSCDALLYFIDPVFSKDPDKRARHLARAEGQVRAAVAEIVRRRANRYLPMVFLLTRVDRLVRLPDEQRDEIDLWRERVFDLFSQEYAPLRGYNPPSLVGPQEALFFPVSDQDDLSQIVEPLARLLAVRTEAERFDRDRRAPALVTALVALVVLGVMFFYLPTLRALLPESIGAWTGALFEGEKEAEPSRVPYYVRELETLPDWDDPSGKKNLLVAQAIGYLGDARRPDAPELSEAIGSAVRRLSEALCFPERTVEQQWRAALFFSGLTPAQLRPWDTEQVPYSVFLPAAIDEIARQRICARTVRTAEEALQGGQPPQETLRLLADALRQEEQEASKLDIIGPDGAIAEVRDAVRYLGDRLKEGGYTVHLRFELLARGENADPELAGHALFPAAGKDDSLEVLKGVLLPIEDQTKPVEIDRRLPLARELTFGLVPCRRLPDGRIECSDNPADFSDRVDFARYRGRSLWMFGFPAVPQGEPAPDEIALADGTRLAMTVTPEIPIPALLRTAARIVSEETAPDRREDPSPGE